MAMKKTGNWSTIYWPRHRLRLRMIRLLFSNSARSSSALRKRTFSKVSTRTHSVWHCESALEIAGFYQYLGCKCLSNLVREDYRTAQEVYGHKTAQEIRSLILERLPLFLHEHTHATTRVSFTWLNNDRNFVVRTFGKITVTRSLNFAGAKSYKSLETSAIARRENKGAIQLWLAGNAQVDMYEIATSLCRLLFDTYKVNDALLFMTILSTDLRALRRRGYNGDQEFLCSSSIPLTGPIDS